MSIWTWLWAGWLGAFLVIEGKALFNKEKGDTLSEHVWRWFSTERTAKAAGQPTGWVRLRRFTLLAFMAWLSAHFVTGGWV
ncbi:MULTISPECIES: hypothetical protein [Streptomyces]|uniref:Uncharacterized protein n=1 Tax=Streptomyces phage phiHau3 TaxID=1204524 RepID=K4IAX9_9CAUD|nr:hypothetical protein phiHau3_3 [Streptomyces phage phiHau3]AFU61984.1 hypothetical protein phiHau3_3 [Streptomyces phage phiHau3]